MLPMDMPVVPVQETSIVLAQAATPGATAQPDYLLKICTEKPSAGGSLTAMNAVDVAGMLVVNIGNHEHRDLYPFVAAVKFSLLESTTHGKLIPLTAGSGRVYYRYESDPDYEGKDRAVFMAEFEGKRYKIVIDLIVSMVIDENSSQCPQPKLIKVTKPSSGSSDYGSGLNLASINVTFVDLDNAAGFVGEGHAREQKEGRGHGPLLQGPVIYPRFY